MIFDNLLCHAGAVVLNAEPVIALLIHPGTDIHLGFPVPREIPVQLLPGANGVNSVLNQLPDEHRRVAVQLLPHQKLHDLILVHGQMVLPRHVPVGFDRALDLAGQNKILPLLLTIGAEQPAAFTQLTVCPIQVAVDCLLDLHGGALRMIGQVIGNLPVGYVRKIKPL